MAGKLTSIRETFLPDEGCVFIRCDLSQVEDRIGKMYCGTERMIELANRRPEVYDCHTENAKAIFGKQEIDKQERYLGKKAVHASWRGMRGDKLSESISKDTDGKVFVPAVRCQKMIDTFLEVNWEIRDIYMPWVREQIRGPGILVNAFGRRLDLRRRRIDDDLYRIGYSFYPQADCADIINQFLFIPITWWMLTAFNHPCGAHVHDEVIVSVPWNRAFEIAQTMIKMVERPIEIPKNSGKILVVPAGITVGSSWGDGRFEFKKLPTKGEFEEKIYALREETLLGKS